MSELILSALVMVVLIWFAGARYLRGPDLSKMDQLLAGHERLNWERFSAGESPSQEHFAVVESLAGITKELSEAPRSQHLALLRQYMNNLTAGRHFEAQFIAANAGGVPAEWVLAPGADGSLRTLYIHGGAWMMGSPLSHRVITSKFSEITRGAVLALDYRLMPENSRMEGIEDCRTAYQWMLANGPLGPQSARTVFVAGDSAGGNLTLALIAWVRDQGLRTPNAAVALSPVTDGTLGSPSLRRNVSTDAMLGPLFGKLARVPRSALLWMAYVRVGLRPSDPHLSPLFGRLSNLPPVLIHASQAEMLLDDSVRYANAAAAAGSRVRLQTWNHMVHVWHIFDPNLTEARQAFEEIRKFLAAHS